MVYKYNPYRRTYAAKKIQKFWGKYNKKQLYKKQHVYKVSPSTGTKSLQAGYDWGYDFNTIGLGYVYQIVFPRATIDTVNNTIVNTSRTSDNIYVSGIKLNVKFWSGCQRKVHMNIAVLECKGQDTDYNNYNVDFFRDDYLNTANTKSLPIAPTGYDEKLMDLKINTDKFNVLMQKKFLLESDTKGVYNNTLGSVAYLEKPMNPRDYKILNLWIPIKREIDFFQGQSYYPKRNFLFVWWPTALNSLDEAYIKNVTNIDPFINTYIQSVVYFRNK